MKLYKLVDTWNRRTGEKEEPEPAETGALACDYTGTILANYEDEPYYAIEIKQLGGAEPTWYYDKEQQWFDDRKIEWASIWDAPFVFASLGGEDVTVDMVKEWLNHREDLGHAFYAVNSFEELCRQARIRTIKKLIEGGMSFLELGLEPAL